MLNLKSADKLKYIIEESFPNISENDKFIIVGLGEEVLNASWYFTRIFGEDVDFLEKVKQIEIKCSQKLINTALECNQTELLTYLKDPAILFYLSSCRVVAMNYANGKNDALESMIKSVKRINS